MCRSTHSVRLLQSSQAGGQGLALGLGLGLGLALAAQPWKGPGTPGHDWRTRTDQNMRHLSIQVRPILLRHILDTTMTRRQSRDHRSHRCMHFARHRSCLCYHSNVDLTHVDAQSSRRALHQRDQSRLRVDRHDHAATAFVRCQGVPLSETDRQTPSLETKLDRYCCRVMHWHLSLIHI